jgi:uncharacterized membrane protein
MLIVLPLALLVAAVAFDLIDAATGTGAFIVLAYWLIAAGIVSGLFAAPFRIIDWLKAPKGTRAWRLGAMHCAGHVAAVGLFAASWLMREPLSAVPVWALALEGGGLGLSLLAAWLGAAAAPQVRLETSSSPWDDSDTRPQRGRAAKAL